jgi:hypothetical protein
MLYIQWHFLAKGIYGINKLWLWPNTVNLTSSNSTMQANSSFGLLHNVNAGDAVDISGIHPAYIFWV